MMPPLYVVTIDGPAGAGKSTIARLLARRIGANYLDTGALYRALAFYLDASGIAPADGKNVAEALAGLVVSLQGGRVFVDSSDVTDKIRTPHVDAIVSRYAELPPLRASLLDLQRSQAAEGPLVADGRDMGTVVFPKADLKIFLSATAEERARRRWKELAERGERTSFEEVLSQVIRRDGIDSSRALAPLCQAEDAVVLDTTALSIEEVLSRLSSLVEERLKERLNRRERGV